MKQVAEEELHHDTDPMCLSGDASLTEVLFTHICCRQPLIIQNMLHLLQWIIIWFYLLMLVNQPAVTCAAANVHEDPDGRGLVDSPDINSAGSLDQQHVLERCV